MTVARQMATSPTAQPVDETPHVLVVEDDAEVAGTGRQYLNRAVDLQFGCAQIRMTAGEHPPVCGHCEPHQVVVLLTGGQS